MVKWWRVNPGPRDSRRVRETDPRSRWTKVKQMKGLLTRKEFVDGEWRGLARVVAQGLVLCWGNGGENHTAHRTKVDKERATDSWNERGNGRQRWRCQGRGMQAAC